MKNNSTFTIPADVPSSAHQEYIRNYEAITHNTGKLVLFACDQKIEHLNQDFYGSDIHPDALQPEHLFKIAHQGTIGAVAMHLGLIARYGNQYPSINYVVKLNGKTNLVPTEQKDPLSEQLWSVDTIVHFKKNSGLSIRGVGLTIYLGSEFESTMLQQAAQTIFNAHQHGLVTLLWIYPRGRFAHENTKQDLCAGSTGVAASLGADFVKIVAPEQAAMLRIATVAAGNTKVICSGGEKKSPELFLRNLYDQIHLGGASGSATGRNIFQHSLPRAIALTKAISAIVLHEQTIEQALHLLQETTSE